MKKKSKLSIFSSIFITLIFIFNNISYSQSIFPDKINPPLVTQMQAPTAESAEFRANVISDMKFMTVILDIAAHFIRDGGRKEDLIAALIEDFRHTRDFLDEQIIGVKSVFEKDGVVYIEFVKNGVPGVAAICDRDRGKVYRASDPRWEIADRFAVFIERDEEGVFDKQEADGMIFDRGLTPDPISTPRAHVIYEVPGLVADGRIRGAIELFFTSAAFQDQKDRLDIPAAVFNELIEVYLRDRSKAGAIRAFAKGMIRRIVGMSENTIDSDEVARSLQLMAGQTMNIISWVERGIDGAERMRLTADKEKMAWNEKRGKSFISADSAKLPEGVSETKEEGKPGFFWRGIEWTKKLGENILNMAVFNRRHFDDARDKLVMYVMDHGFIRVPEGLLAATENEEISTIHETSFINDVLPGSSQTTSTGPGHFQANKLDVKHVTEGRGVQVNVRYNEKGEIVEILAQRIEAGDWCLALPGYVDYIINLGGLRFNDFSVPLSNEQAILFNPHFKGMDDKKLERLGEVVSEKAKFAPYLGVVIDGEAVVMKAMEGAPDAIEAGKIDPSHKVFGGRSMTEAYAALASMDEVHEGLRELADIHAAILGSETPLTAVSLAEAEARLGEQRKVYQGVSPADIEGMQTFINGNEDLLGKVLGLETDRDKLIRIPVEVIESVGIDNIRDFLAAVQSSDHGYVELFSAESILEVSEGKYEEYGITKKALPAELARDRRNRTNTVTVFPVLKGEVLTTGGKKTTREWGLGDMDPDASIISPVGLAYDRAGVVRSIILGLRLSEIAGREEFEKDSDFVSRTLDQYRDLCLSQGLDPNSFDLTGQDMVDIARGEIKVMVQALNKLIRLLPIRPLDTEELRSIYERAREALIRA